MSLLVQELVVLGVVTFAVVYVLARLTGWPRLGIRRKKACGSASPAPNMVILGDCLRRGLRALE